MASSPSFLTRFLFFAILPCFGLIRFADADSVIVLQCYFYYHVSLPLTRCRPALGADALSLGVASAAADPAQAKGNRKVSAETEECASPAFSRLGDAKFSAAICSQ